MGLFGVKDVSKLLFFRLISGEGHQNLLVEFLLAIPRYIFSKNDHSSYKTISSDDVW